MANPITKINRHVPTAEEKNKEAAGRLAEGAAKGHEGLLMLIDIAQEMYEAGYLDLIQGMLKNRRKVEANVFDFIKVAGLPVVMKNVVSFMQFASTIDPHKVQRLLNAFSRGLDEALVTDHEHTGYFSMIKTLRDPDVNRTVTVMLRFLQGMGKDLDKHEQEVNREMNRDKQELMDEM